MNVLVVFSHPRRQSFCGAVLDAFVDGLREAGHAAEIADLHGEGFDPRMTEADEPDRTIVGKRYSDQVLKEQRRIERNASLVLIFPVWWWSFPAMLKGWIDRVWNRDWAYGSRKLPHSRALLIGTASAGSKTYDKYGYGEAMQAQLVTRIMRYCGIQNADLKLMFDSTDEQEIRIAHLETARRLGRDFAEVHRHPC